MVTHHKFENCHVFMLLDGGAAKEDFFWVYPNQGITDYILFYVSFMKNMDVVDKSSVLFLQHEPHAQIFLCLPLHGCSLL